MRLLQNELYKMFRTKKLYVIFFIFVVMRIITVYFSNESFIEATNAQSLPIDLKYDVVQYLCIFTAIYIADILTDEFKTGTIKLSLLRPIGRIRLLNSKIIAMAVYTVVLTLFSVISTYLIGIIGFGWGGSTVYHGVTYSTTEGLLLTAKVYAASLLPLIAFGMICTFVAAAAKNLVTVVSVAFVLFIGGEFLGAVPSVEIYSVVNHMFFFSDYFVRNYNHSGMAFSIVVNLSYIVVFYLLTLVVFRKRDVLC